MINVSIIILNYNTTNYSERLIDSLNRNLNLREAEIILVDNNSKDKSFKKINDDYPNLKIIENDKNYGFAEGNNIGVKSAKGNYLLFLNPDVLINDDVISDLLKYYEQNSNIGVISGLMVDEIGNRLYCYNNFWNIEWELYQLFGFGYNRKIKKMLSRNEILSKVPFEVDWFHGAFLFIRSDIFKALGGFNEEHFMYCEDIELCYDVKKILRLKNVCLPDVKFIHETRATFKDLSKDDLYYFHINRGKLIFLNKYNLIYRNLIKVFSLSGIVVRLFALPFWQKYRGRKREKMFQLYKIVKLHINKRYLLESKYEFVKD